MIIAGVCLLLADVFFAERTPVHIRLVSIGRSAMLSVDGAAHRVVWPRAPVALTIPPADPYRHDWGIDGSESLTLNNLDEMYLKRLASNPYIALDLWLRADAGYDQWQNVRVVDGQHRRMVPLSRPEGVEGTSACLPGAFTFDADIYRIEQAVIMRLKAPTAVYSLRLDRNARSISIANDPIAGTPTMLAQWYFPRDPWPYLAITSRTLLHSVAWALALMILAVLLGAAVPPGLLAVLQVVQWRRQAACLILCALALAGSCAFSLYIALVEYSGMPHTLDAQAYLLQAKIYARGWASLPPPPVIAAFPVPYFGLVHNHWVAQYAPGTSLSLTPGVLAGIPALVQPLLGVGTLTLLFLTGRRLYGTYVAILAVMLGAVSPLHAFLVGTYLSHTVAAFWGMLAYYLLVRSAWGVTIRSTIGAGLAVGMMFLCRELTALLVVMPLTIALLGSAWQRGGMRTALRALVPFVSGLGLCILIYGLYNWSITSSPLLPPRQVIDPSDRYGFGQGHGWWGQHTLAAGLVNLDQLVTGLALDAAGWPFYMTLAVPMLPFLMARATRWDVLNAAIVIAVLAGMVGYFYNGVLFGPRYVYEALPPLLLLTGRGLHVLGEVAGDALARLRRPRLAGDVAAHALFIAFVIPDLLFYLPRQLELYRDFTGLPWRHDLHLGRIYTHAPRQAIVITPDGSVYARVTAALNDPAALVHPTTTRASIWAWAPTPSLYPRLRATFPNRSLLLLRPNGTTLPP
jgi:Dolichyl-phosphate-mannose-protein mannosyltransferase